MAKRKKSGRKSSKMETYVAHASVKKGASAVAVSSAYKIEVRFLGGLSSTQMDAFKDAADRWTKVIVGDLPSVMVNGEVVDDLMIEAKGVDIDGVGGILGQAGPRRLRPEAAGANAFLPATGMMEFDSADLANMQSEGTLLDVITHEMGHVVGVGTIWELKELLVGAGTQNPRFKGTNAKREYGALRGIGPKLVPVENTGGPGTRDGHWRETVFRSELMSGFISEPNNPVSRMTVASLQDLGYVVNMDAAEPYDLPNLFALAEAGAMARRPHAHALPVFDPKVLPDDSMVG